MISGYRKNILILIKGVQIVLIYAKTMVFQNYTGNVIFYSKYWAKYERVININLA